jgi:hypothetical protein
MHPVGTTWVEIVLLALLGLSIIALAVAPAITEAIIK